MTTTEALALYNTATGMNIALSELRWQPDAALAVENLIKAAAMTERMGGRFHSRQAIATIILFSKDPTP